ncbi:hypothetical protein [Clostridium estertheticum]|uniref:hypothetical protein n=1 Tax=Clostridium estertheticum TaxID=238834 RepID=UPI001C0CE7CA|nr:hypothetical protein [Clostridium estertheticum]MBU3173362.1 hypothetical protein [Clostridium estertheticum]
MIKKEKFLTWLDTFLNEKKLINKNFQIDYAGVVHFIDSNLIIDLIRQTSSKQQAQIKNTIVKIDFHNGDVNSFLEHLATGYVKENY